MAAQKITVDINMISPKFRPVISNKRKYKILKGGRGSGKTVFVPQYFILLYLQEKNRNAVFFRRYKTQARDSVYMSMRNVLQEWGLLDTVVQCNITRMEFYFPNGNTIRCRGLDDPEGAKSSSFDKGYLTDIWFEEGDQITPEALRTAVLTIRAKDPNVFLTFNPVSKNSWIYKMFFSSKRTDTYINSSTYMDNPYLPLDYILEMERIREEDEELYNLVCLGNWGDLKDVIYNKIRVEEIPLDDSYYDHIFYGLDFGYNDPMAWVKVGVKDNVFYVIDEIYKNRISADELCSLLEEHEMPKGKDIESDHDKERQLILQRNGYRSINADKSGKKSDRIKLIKPFQIIVHPRCENFLKESSLYKWKKDKENGGYKDEPIEVFDHLMDAFSYAVIKYVKQRVLGSSNKVGVSKSRVNNNNIKTGSRGRR